MSKNPIPVQAQGEYGATTVDLTQDKSAYRIAFGRNDGMGGRIMMGAVILTH